MFYLLIYVCIYSFIYVCIYLFIYSFTYSFIPIFFFNLLGDTTSHELLWATLNLSLNEVGCCCCC